LSGDLIGKTGVGNWFIQETEILSASALKITRTFLDTTLIQKSADGYFSKKDRNPWNDRR